MAFEYIHKLLMFYGVLTKDLLVNSSRMLLMAKIPDHWNTILPNLILGALPITNKVGNYGDHLTKLKMQLDNENKQLGAIFSIMEKIELDGFGFPVINFANTEDWNDLFPLAEHIIFEVTDFSANITISTLSSIADKIHGFISDDKLVYIHCKSGKGRSWMITMAYLIKYEKMTYDEAKAFVLYKRYNVNPNQCQEDILVKYYDNLNEKN